MGHGAKFFRPVVSTYIILRPISRAVRIEFFAVRVLYRLESLFDHSIIRCTGFIIHVRRVHSNGSNNTRNASKILDKGYTTCNSHSKNESSEDKIGN